MKKEVKIGIFAFAMLLLLFWGINFLKGRNLFTTSHTFYTTFDNVDGLNVSGDVMFRGIKVGTITDIDFDPRRPERIVVEFSIARKYPVPDDSHITTVSPYVIADKVMVIEYGTSPQMYRSRDTIPSVTRPDLLARITDGLGPVQEQLAGTIDGLNRVLNSLNALLSEENLSSLGTTFHNVERLSGSLRASADNLNAVTANLRDNSENIDNILANASQFSDSLRVLRLAEAVGNLNTTLAGLNEVVAKTNAGEGSLAMLLNDPALYQGLQSSSESLNALLEDLRANPGRYVRFSLFGRKN